MSKKFKMSGDLWFITTFLLVAVVIIGLSYLEDSGYITKTIADRGTIATLIGVGSIWFFLFLKGYLSDKKREK